MSETILLKKTLPGSFFFTKDLSSHYNDSISIQGENPKYYEYEIVVLQIGVIDGQKVLVEAIKKQDCNDHKIPV